MLEKWKQWAVELNFRKAVILFIITGFVAAIAFSAAVYGNFRGRISEWEQFSETDREHGKEEREYNDDGDFDERKEKDWEDISKMLHLSAGDVALIAGCGIIGIAIGIWYWALVLIWVYRKACRMGVNAALWALAALVFNLAALVALYLYTALKGTCANCGRVWNGSGKFCDRCGNLMRKECPQCRQTADISSLYCSNCGKKLDEKEK